MFYKLKRVVLCGKSLSPFLPLFGAVVGLAVLGVVIVRTTDIGGLKEKLPAVFGAAGEDYYVSPTGDNTQTGKNRSQPLASIQKALARAQPGDTVHLADGAYMQSIESVRSGTAKSPITIRGGQKAVIYGSSSRIFQIHHSYLVLDGFQINGQWSRGNTAKSFRDKLLYVIGARPGKGVEGLKIKHMLIQNAGGECIRLRYFARHNEVSHTTVRNCGIYDFRFAGGGKNGEGIYIGTAPEQTKDGKNPTAEPDGSAYNYIHHNLIETNGNECVDIKEAAFANLVEHNTCRGQSDDKSGGFDARGNNNVFRYNLVEHTLGAAVRLGGDSEEDGTHNDVYGNTFKNNGRGPLNIQRLPQGKICGNSTQHTNTSSSDNDDIDPTKPCR
jgi:hypothetical protein